MIGKQTILFLGTAHFNNPENKDMFSIEHDNMLDETRQTEIKNVVDALAQFRPTKIALEYSKEKNDKINHDYQAFLTKSFNLTSNEYHQIGFQLAKKVNHDKVFSVDWNGAESDIPNIEKWAKEHTSSIFNEVTRKGGQLSKVAGKFLKKHTIGEFLLYLNHPNRIRMDHEMYMRLALVGSNSESVGAIWTSKYWYYRNMLIYKNIVELVDSEDERIFVLYGAGHLHLLIQFLKESGMFNVERASDYL